jgi:probable rRNA maturation factor
MAEAMRRGGFVVQVTAGRVRLPMPAGRVRRIVQAVLRGEPGAVRRAGGRGTVAVTFLGPAGMRVLNRAWTGHDRSTDVLSFALTLPGGGTAADVYICAAVARRSARELGITAMEEIVRLVVHGTLHALGYDHPDGGGRTRSAMWRRQERYVKALA